VGGEHDGGRPVVIWLVPTEQRLQTILHVWREAWPTGHWMMTTNDRLAADRWLEYRSGTVKERAFFDPPAANRPPPEEF